MAHSEEKCAGAAPADAPTEAAEALLRIVAGDGDGIAGESFASDCTADSFGVDAEMESCGEEEVDG